MKSFAACVLALAGALGAVACTGSVNSDKPTPAGNAGASSVGGASAGGSSPTAGGPAATCRSDGSLAQARISLISDVEYTNIIRDAFGVTFVPEVTAVRTGEYPLDESAQIASADVAKQYYRAADQVASKLKPCGAAALSAACVDAFLREKLPR